MKGIFNHLLALVLVLLALNMRVSADNTAGLLLILERRPNNQIQYIVEGRKYSEPNIPALLRKIFAERGQNTPVFILFDRRLSIADVGALSGELTGIGFGLPRFFMYDEERSRVWEINLTHSEAFFDYTDFIKDPFTRAARPRK